MSEQHTQGLMSYQDKRPSCSGFSLFIGDQYIAFIRDSDGRIDAELHARRFVACWNACQGIDTADLEAGSVSIVDKLRDEAAKLVLAQRDELLAVLKRSRPFIQAWPQCRDSETPHIDGCGLLEAVDAAIASVKGGG